MCANTSFLNIKKLSFLAIVFAFLALVPFDPVMASGLDSAKKFMGNIKDILTGISAVVVTIAIIWSGFKMVFQGASFRDIAPILIGGFLIGAAGVIANMLVNG